MNIKKLFFIAFRLVVLSILVVISGSVMLGSILGVSIITASKIITAAYQAYKAGRSIKVAIAAFTGPGALLWLAFDFIVGVGIAKVLGSSWAISA